MTKPTHGTESRPGKTTKVRCALSPGTVREGKVGMWPAGEEKKTRTRKQTKWSVEEVSETIESCTA